MLQLPKIGLGTWKLSPNACKKSVLKALDIGYRLIDTAQIYRNEEAVGDATAQSAVPREEYILATKLWITQLNPVSVQKSTEKSLQKLRTDYVDILYIHWPKLLYNPKKTLPAMAKLVDEGKVKYIGVSNFSTKDLDAARSACPKPITVNQVEHHPLLQQRILRSYLAQHDIALVAYSPLGRGNLEEIPVLKQVAQKHEVSVAQVALAWEMAHDSVPIPKATSEEHLRDNYAALELVLDDEDIQQIDAISVKRRFLNMPFISPKWDD